jgi:CHASE2 domain-containing sensor protein
VREGPESTLIDYRVPVERLDRISYRDLQGILEGRPERVRGKLVLLGATYAGSGDTHADPAGGKRLSGLEVQTLILHSFLSGSVPELGFLAILAGALALSLAGAALATIVVRSRPGLLAATAVASLGGLGAGAGLFLSTSLLPPFLAWSLAPALGALLGHRLGILPARGRRRRP